MTFNYEDVKTAHERISDIVRKTPLEESYFLGDENRKYFFKLESTQRAKSFKIRGAVNKMMSLSEKEKEKGVATISSGNHGSSVSYAATLLGIKNIVVIVPRTTPQSKVDKIKYFGGQVTLIGQNYDEAHSMGMEYIKDMGLTYIDPYDKDPLVYAGQGTVAIEILQEKPEIDTIVVPVGGGGILTGIGVAVKAINPKIRVIGVQTEACPALIKSYEDGIGYWEYPTKESLCDCLVGGIGKLCYAMAKDYVDDIIEVSEETIGRATAFLAKEEKYIAEAGSCVTIAAVMDYRERVGGKNIALVITGGNIDGDLLAELLEKY